MIDASIPLQVQTPKLMGPQELMSLRDLATRSRSNEISLQEKEMELGKKNALRQLLQSPDVSDPATGRITPQGLAKISQIDPTYGMQLGHQQDTLRLQDLAINEKKQSIGRRVMEGYVSTYDRAMRETGNREEALRIAREARTASIDELQANGTLKASGLTDAEIQRARSSNMEPDQVRALVLSMGGKVDSGQPVSTLGKLEADFRAGKIARKDYEEEKRKMTAPTMQMQMADIHIAPEDKAFWADIIRKGGSLPPGLARSAAGAKLVSEVMKEVPKGNTAAADVIANQAELVGMKAGQRTLGTKQAQIEMAVTEAQNMAPLALQASEKVNRTKYPTLNTLLLAAEKGSGDENVVRLGVATNSLINIYARAINPTGVATVSDKDHARELLAAAWSKGQYKAGIDQLMMELAAARKSPEQVRGAMRETLTGKKEGRRASDSISADDEALINKYK